jgi:hypothetical protein
MLLSAVCKPLPMDLPGILDMPGARAERGSHRRRSAVPQAVAGLFALVALVVGCGRPHPASTSDERAAAALVDGCRGVADGALCNDHSTCTVGDRCAAGLCVGALAPDGTSCTDDNQCTVMDLCLQGVCKGAAVAEGTLCTDGDPCTEPDVCHLGQCTSGGPTTCDDGDPCTVDRCLESEGCLHDAILTCSDAGMTGDGDAGDAGVGDASDETGTDGAPEAADDGAVGAEADGGIGDGAEGPIDGAPPDLPAVDGSAADAVADASDAADTTPDSGSEAGEDGGGDGGTVDIARIYEARGGACVCSAAPGGPRSGSALIAVLALMLLRVRGRRPRTDRWSPDPFPAASTSRGRVKNR